MPGKKRSRSASSPLSCRWLSKPLTTAVAAGIATLIIGLNAFLLYDTFLG